MNAIIRSPRDCSASEIEAFVALVREGRAVSEGDARYGATHAFRLAFVLHTDGTAIAVGALKQPELTYRNHVFMEAGAMIPASAFQIELGYIAVAAAFRKQGLSHSIVHALLPHSVHENIFATTRADKEAMQHTLPAAGFVQEGRPYPSQGGNYNLLLYVRLASQLPITGRCGEPPKSGPHK